MKSGTIKKFFTLFSVVLFFNLLVFYIIQINKITKESSLIFDYQKEISQLYQDNKKLEAGIFQNNSIESIEILANNLSYEKIGKVHYIQILESTAIAR